MTFGASTKPSDPKHESTASLTNTTWFERIEWISEFNYIVNERLESITVDVGERLNLNVRTDFIEAQ